ncbi:MAG: DUF188 domain-containing protein [Peptococcaceae bacterium]|nr:DUF188 domain-containing protein [Peptococcaceae bacterium]
MKIIIDADATPRRVLEISIEIAKSYSLELWTVASFNHVIDWSNHITVGDGSQETDLKIMSMASKGDLIITQDFGLAAMLLGKKAMAISPAGRIFYPDTIDSLLEEREIKAKYRRQGGRTSGPSKRKEQDNILFKKNICQIIDNALLSKE